MHAMAAEFLKSQYIAIEMSEAEKLDEAIFNVMEHYDLPDVNPAVMDWILLAQTLGMVYGTRYVAWRTEQRARAAKPVAPVAGDPASRPQPGAPTAPLTEDAPRTQPQRVFVEGIGMVDQTIPEGVHPPSPRTRQ